MSSVIPDHLGKKIVANTDMDDKDKQITKLKAEVLVLAVKNSELEREIIHLNRELLVNATMQLDLQHMVDGGYGNDN